MSLGEADRGQPKLGMRPPMPRAPASPPRTLASPRDVATLLPKPLSSQGGELLGRGPGRVPQPPPKDRR